MMNIYVMKAVKICRRFTKVIITNLDSIKKQRHKKKKKKQRHYFVNKGPSSQGYGFSSGHVWMWELDHKES